MKTWRTTTWLIACGLLLSSCSVSKRVGMAQAEVMRQFHALAAAETLPTRVLPWQVAVQMMLENNVEYLQACQTLEDARRQERAVFRSLIPSAHLGYYYSRALLHRPGDLNAANYGGFDANIIFNLPELMHLPVEKYARALAVFKAEKDCEMKRRELTAKLYMIYLQSALERAERQAELSEWSDAETRKRQQEEHRLAQRERLGELCKLLGNYDARWQPETDGMPRVRMQHFRTRVKEPSRLSQVMMALELEASRLRKLGIALRYWPNTQVNFYSPTLFSMSGGNMGGFTDGVKDVRMSLNLYLPIDTRLDTWQEYQNAKDQHELLLRQLRQRMYDWRENMRLVMESWEKYESWREANEAYIRFRRHQGAQDPDGVMQLHRESLNLQREIRDQERKNIERICALIQEYGLPQDD